MVLRSAGRARGLGGANEAAEEFPVNLRRHSVDVDALAAEKIASVFDWYLSAQLAGGLSGTFLAHVMFGLCCYSISMHARPGWALALSEFVGTFGLIAVIATCSKSKPKGRSRDARRSYGTQ